MASCSNLEQGTVANRPPMPSVLRRAGWPALALLAVLCMAVPAAAEDDPPPPCPDSDGDGFVQCSSACTTPADKQCGDCDEGDVSIHRGANCALCNGPGCAAQFCVPGSTVRPCPDVVGNRNEINGFCLNAGLGLTCADNGSGDACTPGLDPVLFAAEGGSTLGEAERRAAASCSDLDDNDCDGLVDVADPDCQTPEICDGRDNDGNGLFDDVAGVGVLCTAGIGACQATGTTFCAPDGSIACNAAAAGPGVEGPFGSPKCSDGVDNDCDGLTDFPDDPSCRGPEVCDGLDNDGDGDTDEGFDVGAPCSAGVSACEVAGQKVCAASGLTTICNAVPALGTVEGPTNPGSCSDGIDNDCDGFTDAADASCGTVDLRVTCALPFETPPRHGRGSPGRDCNSVHRIVFDEPDGIDVSAELVALSPQGTVMGAIPVKNGEQAHLASRLSPEDFHVETHTTGTGDVRHKIFAPMPMLRVSASDGVRKAVAYCSVEPYVDVVKPSGGVVSLNKGATGDQPDITPVLVALPRVQESTLVVKVDGVDVFVSLGTSPTACSPAAPCSGDIVVGADTVHVSGLIVDVAANVGDRASNTLAMNLEGLGCGGHVVAVSGTKIPGSTPDRVTSACLVDDLADRGTSFSFEVEITSPVTQSANNPVPTPVIGRVCHGLPIESVTLNGAEIFEPGLLTTTPAPSADTAATFEFPIDVTVTQTNVARDVLFGDHPAGSFDPGSNFVQAAAADSMGNRVFNNSVVFATGQTAQPGVGALATPLAEAMDPEIKAAIEAEVAARFREAVADVALTSTEPIEVPNAFVVALDGDALTNFFVTKCSAPGEDGLTLAQRFRNVAKQNLDGKHLKTIHPSFLCSCDPSVPIRITTVDIEGEVECPVLFPGQIDPDGEVVPDDAMRVVIELPNVMANISGSGSCKTKVLGVCVASSSVSLSLQARIADIRLKFDITESQLEGSAAPGDPDFHASAAAAIESTISVNSSVGCIGGAFCEAIVTVLTLGQLDLTPNITIDRTFDLAREIGQAEPDPISLNEIKLDEEEIANFNQTVRGDLVDVNISSHGLRASLTGRFSTEFVDPEIVANPGSLLEMPPTPELPFPLAGGVPNDGAVMVNADAINMMFASLTLSGRLKSECSVSLDPSTGEPRTLGSLLPADCDTLNGPNHSATALGRGFCHGLRESSCENLQAPGGLLFTPIEQGFCNGMQGANCSLVPAGFDGIVLPADCDSIAIGGGDSDDPSRATAIAQGRCWGRQGAACESLSPAGTADLTAVKQGACHGEQGAVCVDVPTQIGSAAPEIGTCTAVQDIACNTLGAGAAIQCNLAKIQINIVEALLRAAEQGACSLAPSLNITANQPLLFCARQDLPPRFLVRDDLSTDPVEVGLRLNDLSVAVVVDRDQDGQLTGQLTSTPPCFGEGSVPSGDCSLAALCLDLNFVASFELAEADECPAGGGPAKPGFKARILDVQPLTRVFGQVCGGLPAGDDATAVSEATTGNASIDSLRMNAEAFSPPACIQGLTLGGFVTFEDPTIFSLRTGAPTSVCIAEPDVNCTSSADCAGGECVPIQNFIGISTKIVP